MSSINLCYIFSSVRTTIVRKWCTNAFCERYVNNDHRYDHNHQSPITHHRPIRTLHYQAIPTFRFTSTKPIMMLRMLASHYTKSLSRVRASPHLASQQLRHHGDGHGPNAPTINLTFINPDDSQTTVSARIGESLLQTAHRTGIEIEGACEGVCACSTCHVILTQDLYDKLLDETEDGHLSEDEEDMLDMAFGLTHTSRLGCQIAIGEGMEGCVITLPKATRNFYVDGHKPKPH
jgi:ferredoxin